jgi:hypothetical protein
MISATTCIDHMTDRIADAGPRTDAEKQRFFRTMMARSVIRFSSAANADAHHRGAVSCRIRNRKRSS